MSAEDSRITCAVIGAGAWGTTLALMLGRQGRQVRLWARRPETARQIQSERENFSYLPGFGLPDTVSADSELGSVLEGADAVILAVPSVGLRQVASEMVEYLSPEALLICATKGLERGTGKRMSQVLADELGAPYIGVTVALSGPNLSREIAQELPAVSVAASDDIACGERAQVLLSSDIFRVYTNCDIIGVELGGALKNVIAVGAGVSDGLGYGDNAKASLITRGLADMSRLGCALGARPQTFWGIAGVGDLIATCGSRLSRNWTLGYRLGQGEPLAQVLDSMHDVAEGYYTTDAARQKATETGVEVPIIQAVAGILYDNAEPAQVARRLMSRRRRDEHEDWHGSSGEHLSSLA